MKPKPKYTPVEISFKNVVFFYRKLRNDKTDYRIGFDTKQNKIVFMDALTHVGMVPIVNSGGYSSIDELKLDMADQGWLLLPNYDPRISDTFKSVLTIW